MPTQERGVEIYSWGDTLSLTGNWEDLRARPRMALAVSTERTGQAQDALSRAGWIVRSLKELSGRAGTLIRADKP